MEFRKDVNGLRAIAVLAVVFFHFNHNILPGGFVGVDVFFVISGFLMTTIIYGGISRNKFKLWDFYKARGRRIVPALAVMLLVVLIYGWFSMFTTEFKTLGKHATSSLLFISNIVYWKESSYFAPGAEEKWLLHTWSLSVEWQFYLIYPIFILAVRKIFSNKWSKILILLATIFSLIVSIYSSRILVSSSFFMLPTRAWEMLAGGLVYLYGLDNLKGRTSEIIGILLIVFSLFCFSGEDYWPSYNALLPVVGAMLVIFSKEQRGILSIAPLQFLGKTSYSIYLWHWPIYLYIYNTYGGVDYATSGIGIVASIVVGYISYRYIEMPCKEKDRKSNLFLYGLCLAFSVIVYNLHGVKSSTRPISETKANDLVEHYDGYKFDVGGMWDKCNSSEKLKNIDASCVDTTKKGGVFLWGDSHAGALSLGIRSLLSDKIHFNQLAASSCKPSLTPFPGIISATIGCNYSNKIAIDSFKIIKPDVVIIAQRFNHEQTNWVEIADKLHSIGVKKVILLGPVPQWKGSLPLIVAKNYDNSDIYIDGKYLDSSIESTNKTLSEISKKTKSFDFVDIFNSLCEKSGSDTKCMSRVNSDYTIMSMDYGHPTDEGAKFIADKIIKKHIPKELLKQ